MLTSLRIYCNSLLFKDYCKIVPGQPGSRNDLSDMKKPTIDAIEAEIQQERAEALGRAGERLEEALRVLWAIRGELEGKRGQLHTGPRDREAGGGVPEEANPSRYRAWHARVVELRHFLIIQREAIGFRRHDDVDRHYPMPPDLPPRGEPERGEPR